MRHGRIQVNGTVWIQKAERAVSLKDRLRGLLGRTSLGPDAALLIERCGAVHTVGMRFALDLVFLDHAGRVLRVIRGVRPGRLWVGGGWRAARTLELEAGCLDVGQLRCGDVLTWSEDKA